MGAPTAGKPRRASRKQIRVWAWTVGAFSFLAPWALFGLSPRPVANAAPVTQKKPARAPTRPVVLVITKKIVVGAASSSSTTTSGAPINYVYAPAPAAPAAVSCATPPC